VGALSPSSSPPLSLAFSPVLGCRKLGKFFAVAGLAEFVLNSLQALYILREDAVTYSYID
jgi:hypothetical protein